MFGVGLIGAATPAAAEDDLTEWGMRVYDAFAAKQRYPRAALDEHLEGTVKIQVTVSRSGQIIGFAINQSSGHEVLDGEVINILNRINPLPPLPEGLQDFIFKIPLRFNMEDQNTDLGADVQVAEGASDWKAWQRAVGRIIRRNQGYPARLIEDGIEGSVKMRVDVATDGTIIGQQVVESSGHPLLDEEAVYLMRRIAFPALPEERASISLTIPLNYRINTKS
jgi:TonB family protein